MATTGTFAFAPTLASLIDEAWERTGMDPANITPRHAASARRSLEAMLYHWQNLGVLQWAVDLQSVSTTVGMQSFAPASGTIDLLDVTLLRDGYETPMHPISREAYQFLPDKDQQGRPNQYYVLRGRTPTVYVWPAGENTTDAIKYYRIRQIEDTGALSTNPDIPVRFYDALVYGLSARLAEKFAPTKADMLSTKANIAFAQARTEDRERADMTMTTSQGRYRRRG